MSLGFSVCHAEKRFSLPKIAILRDSRSISAARRVRVSFYCRIFAADNDLYEEMGM